MDRFQFNREQIPALYRKSFCFLVIGILSTLIVKELGSLLERYFLWVLLGLRTLIGPPKLESLIDNEWDTLSVEL